MTVDPQARTPAEVQALNADASVLMKEGIRLLTETRAGAVQEALACFDHALDIRRRLPVESDPMLGFGLAACWLNRADALVRLGGATAIVDALGAYDEGITVMRRLPLGDDPRFPRRLAIAHQNRGLALQAQGTTASPDAMTAFAEAIAVLEDDRAALIPDRSYLLAVAWTNLANLRAATADVKSPPSARDAALTAIDLVKTQEWSEAEAADVGLRARHVLCRTIAGRLPAVADASGSMPDEVHEATDAVDDGLAIVRGWEQKGVGRFRTLAYDLFRFGARVYALYQPQFLHEFIAENMDPDRSSALYVSSIEMQSAHREALALLSMPEDPTA